MLLRLGRSRFRLKQTPSKRVYLTGFLIFRRLSLRCHLEKDIKRSKIPVHHLRLATAPQNQRQKIRRLSLRNNLRPLHTSDLRRPNDLPQPEGSLSIHPRDPDAHPSYPVLPVHPVHPVLPLARQRKAIPRTFQLVVPHQFDQLPICQTYQRHLT